MASPETPHVPALPSPRFFFGVSLGACAFFAVWSWFTLKHGTIPAFDLECAHHWRDWTEVHPGSLAFMVFLTDMGGIAASTLIALMGSIWQTAIKHRVLAIAWLGIAIGGGLINLGCKEAFDRSRPEMSLRDRAVLENNESYPSGHSMGSAVSYGLLGYALILPQRHRPRRMVAILFMISMVLAVGFSRIYLRAHWFSDVIGGWSIGIAWLFFCLGWLERHRRGTSV